MAVDGRPINFDRDVTDEVRSTNGGPSSTMAVTKGAAKGATAAQAADASAPAGAAAGSSRQPPSA